MDRDLSPVISQPAAAFCIQVPMLDTTVATHKTANARWPKGLQDEPARWPAASTCPAPVACPADMLASEATTGAAERTEERAHIGRRKIGEPDARVRVAVDTAAVAADGA